MLKLKEKEIRDLIRSSGLSVRCWAIEHGFPQSTLSNWINGGRNITKKNLEILAAELNVKDLSTISNYQSTTRHLTFDDTDATGIQELTAAVKENTAIMEKLIERLDQIFR